MKRIALKSRHGCLRCRNRRKKCDEQKPICGECLRLGFKCRWKAAEHTEEPVPSNKLSLSQVVEEPSRQDTDSATKRFTIVLRQSNGPSRTHSIETFDHPAILQAGTTSIVHGFEEKNALQYLCEQGHSILRYPTQRYPTHASVNSFRSGFYMASNSPTQVKAYLCLGAGYLSELHPQYERTALKHYNNVITALRSDLQGCEQEPPAEWTCAVAAILSRYEMVVFNSPQARLAHLLGFHRLVEARVYWQQPWGPTRMLLEHYVHSFSNNSLFQYEVIVKRRPIGYVDGLIRVLNEKPRPLGREVVGVPENLTVAAYKLACLNVADVSQSPWDVELLAVAAALEAWEPPTHALKPTGNALLLVGRLYHLACICLVQSILNRFGEVNNNGILACVTEACLLVQQSDLSEHPFNNASWPLTILGIFAVDPLERMVLRQPLESLVKKSRLKGYSSVLTFLSHVSQERLGPGVLQRPDLLSMVQL